MTDKIRYYCLTEAANYTDRDAYISDLSLSSIWRDQPEDDIPAERLEYLGILYDLYNMPVRQIRKATGLSQSAFCARYSIPARTLENWEAGVRTPPLYVKLLLAESVGLWRRKEAD